MAVNLQSFPQGRFGAYVQRDRINTEQAARKTQISRSTTAFIEQLASPTKENNLVKKFQEFVDNLPLGGDVYELKAPIYKALLEMKK